MEDDPYAGRRGLRVAYGLAMAAFVAVFLAWTKGDWGGALATPRLR